jgi:hypothetical protein
MDAATNATKVKTMLRVDLVFIEATLLFQDNHTGKNSTQTHRFVDDSYAFMVLSARQKPAECWSTVLK